MSKKLDELRQRTAQAERAKAGKTGEVAQAIVIHANHAQQRIFMQFTHPTDHMQFTLEQAAAHGMTVLSAAIAYGTKFSGDFHKELDKQIARAREICAREIAQNKAKAN